MTKERWSFFRAGAVDQVVLASGADVAAIPKLDKKLWVALACPVNELEIDAKTLELLDLDKDKRIRPPEIIDAIRWADKVFKSLDLLFEKGTDLPLDGLDTKSEEGKAVLAAAKRILADRDKKDADAISLEDVVAMQEVLAGTRFNGDGIVPPESAGDDEATKKVLEDIVAAVGSVPDRSGKPGVDKAIVEEATKGAAELLAWVEAGKQHLAFGDATSDAFAALVAIESKIDDFFTRCQLAAFDPRGATLLAPSEADLGGLPRETLSANDEAVAKLPLSRVDASGALSLESGVNPAWSARLAAFKDKTLKVAADGDKPTLTKADFDALKERFAPYRDWYLKKPSAKVGSLAVERLRAIVDEKTQAEIATLIEKDVALEAEYTSITLVEKAVRIRQDLLTILRNFVNFADFYSKKKGAFQAGTLYLDGRACTFCVLVTDPAKHAKLAGLAKAYLAYCDCTRTTEKGPEKRTIVAAFTDGDVDNLMIGRNGVFYDRKGNDWDATITSIVENPLSVRQAFWAPYKKLVRMIEEQIAKRAADKEKAADATVGAAATSTAEADATPAAKPSADAKPGDKKVDVGTVAAIGVAVAGVSSFLALVFGKFVDLGIWMPFAFVGILLAISGPSMLIAWLKLRQRNIGPILDASGWAVNAMCRINVPFGRSLTSVAHLPEGATRTANDPYAEKPTPWLLYAFLLLVVIAVAAWSLGKLDAYLPANAQAKTVLPHSDAAPSPSTSAAPAPSK